MANEFDSSDEGENATQAPRPKTKKFKDTTARLRSGKEGSLSHRPSVDWRHDSEDVCTVHAAASAPRISELTEILSHSRTGEALINEAASSGLTIVYDTQIPGAQYYPRDEESGRAPVITLNPGCTRGELLNMLARELRRAWQQRHGALVNPLSFDPDEAILINRAQTADTLMIGIRIAWELKLSGEQEAWNHLAGSPMADVGRAFEVKAREDFRSLNNGEAPRAAYDKFFEDSRTKAHDKRLIHQMLLDENGYMRRARSPHKGLSPEIFARLGEVPSGRNYLSMRSSRAPTDAAYAAIEDRSNANFLWFIKFERSFHEKELQMVQEAVRLSAEIVDFAKAVQQRVVPETEQA